jgi:hypothetical protein
MIQNNSSGLHSNLTERPEIWFIFRAKIENAVKNDNEIGQTSHTGATFLI